MGEAWVDADEYYRQIDLYAQNYFNDDYWIDGRDPVSGLPEPSVLFGSGYSNEKVQRDILAAGAKHHAMYNLGPGKGWGGPGTVNPMTDFDPGMGETNPWQGPHYSHALGDPGLLDPIGWAAGGVAGRIAFRSGASLGLTAGREVAEVATARLTIVDDLVLSGGRGGSRVKNLAGPPNSVIRGSQGRIYITNDRGQVVWDVTAARAKKVQPGEGFVRNAQGHTHWEGRCCTNNRRKRPNSGDLTFPRYRSENSAQPIPRKTAIPAIFRA